MRHRQDRDPTANLTTDGDGGFTGVNCLLAPDLLEPGLTSDARNKRFFAGRAETRLGVRTPIQFNPEGGWGSVYGTGTFSDPNGVEWLLIATADGVYRTREDQGPTSLIELEDGQTLSAECDLVQAFDRVLLFRGTEEEPLVWDGTSTGRFVVPPDPSAEVSFLERIPGADYGVVMSGRAFAPVGRDQVAASDLLDYTSWDTALNTFRVNSGEDDAIVGLAPFRRGSLLVLKQKSLHRITGLDDDLGNVAQECINPDVGCVARRSVAPVGGDVYWLGAEGVMRLSEVLQESMQTQELPVSEPIRPWIQRINWRYAHTACARTVGRFYYLAVPLDSATRPNTLLVYDTTTRLWNGMDTFPTGVALDRLHAVTYLGLRRLVSVDTVAGRVLVHEVGKHDEIDGTEHGIQDLVITRGYGGAEGKADLKRWKNVSLEVSTWAPSLTVTALTEGQAEEREVGTLTRDRTRYTVHGRGLHDVTDGDLHDEAYRQDYEVRSDDGISTGTHVLPELEQTTLCGWRLRDTGRYVQIQVTGSTGWSALRMVRVDGVRRLNMGRIY